MQLTRDAAINVTTSNVAIAAQSQLCASDITNAQSQLRASSDINNAPCAFAANLSKHANFR